MKNTAVQKLTEKECVEQWRRVEFGPPLIHPNPQAGAMMKEFIRKVINWS